jgi:hypothetical protein
MADNPDDKPKIIVDSDWKEQARKEKEEADRQTREMPRFGPLPAPSIVEIIQMIVLQTAVGLGGMQDPQTGQRLPANLAAAKHYIDLLELLEQKTQGHLDETETKVLANTLHEMRMAFVEAAGVGASESRQRPPAEA